LPKKKLMTARVLAAMVATRRGVLKRWAVLVEHFLKFLSNAESCAFDLAGEFDGLPTGRDCSNARFRLPWK
jgi:hypothetical protein